MGCPAQRIVADVRDRILSGVAGMFELLGIPGSLKAIVRASAWNASGVSPT